MRGETQTFRGENVARDHAVIGFQGLVPYRYEVESALFISQDGDVSARFQTPRDFLLTQRLILQGRLKTHAAIQKAERFTTGQGLNNIELGLRLRYEIRRGARSRLISMVFRIQAMTGPIDSTEMKKLYHHRWQPNLKIPLFYGIWIGLGAIAWNSPHWTITWLCYLAMGYMQMGIMTFMHDCTHSTLFKAKWKNLAFGSFAIIPMLISFISFKEDHLLHHRHNRSPRDPDAFTMGKRGFGDYILFYAYALIGVFLTAIQFIFIFPLQKFRGKKALIHWSEIAFHIVVIVTVFNWASSQGIVSKVFSVWFWPLIFFGFFNSVRFVAEHYGTPWNSGQLAGTRTIISNQVNSWFWNNINYHIGHHMYPGVPWYNLQELHERMLPEIARQHAIVDKSYFSVFFYAMVRGPESIEQNIELNAARGVGTGVG